MSTNEPNEITNGNSSYQNNNIHNQKHIQQVTGSISKDSTKDAAIDIINCFCDFIKKGQYFDANYYLRKSL